MPATPASRREVLEDLERPSSKWRHSDGHNTISGDPSPLAWDAALFAEAWFGHQAHSSLEEAIYHFPLRPREFGYDIAEWHGKQHPPDAMLKAHLVRLVKGWGGETALLDYFDEKPELPIQLGFDTAPSQSALWRAWHKRLSDDHQDVMYIIAQVFVQIAREKGVAAPDDAFVPDLSVDADGEIEQDSAAVETRAIKKTKQVWPLLKPMVDDAYWLPRGANHDIHEGSWWEAHAFMGAREEMYAEAGARSFAADTSRERVQSGSNHRHQLTKITPMQAREMHRETTKQLVARARQDSELTGDITASIDITKSNPYRTGKKLEFDEDDNCTNEWLLGYKNDEYAQTKYYFQWATIQITGLDIPLVLDAIPVPRGMPRWMIVDELLEGAQEIINVDLVKMDKEFDGDAVKTACERNGVQYLNPARMFTSEKAKCTRLRKAGKTVHIEEQKTLDEDLPSRKRVYVPAINPDRTGDDGDEDEEDEEEEDDDGDSLHQEMLEDFAEATGKDVETAGRMFSDITEEIREEDEEHDLPGDKSDSTRYILFETNDPNVSAPDSDTDRAEVIHMATRSVRRYRHRWGIENGFKQIKTFRVRTTSMEHEYRFFNFMFACTLYNAWRMVDLLVKLELLDRDDIERAPLVTADLFLTIAKQYFGLDPPD